MTPERVRAIAIAFGHILGDATALDSWERERAIVETAELAADPACRMTPEVRGERRRLLRLVRQLRDKWRARMRRRQGFEGAARAVQALDEAINSIRRAPRRRSTRQRSK